MEKNEELLNSEFNTIEEIKDESVNRRSADEANKNLFGAKSSALIGKFVEHYGKRNHQNRHLRVWFFSFSFFLIFSVVGAFVAFIIIMALNDNINVEAAVSICGVCVTVLTTLIVLPKMVGRNLFPTTEDKEILRFVKQMNVTELEFAKLNAKSDDEPEKNDTLKSKP